MKKIFLLLSFMFICNSVLAQGYCPTPNEFHNKMQYFQIKAIRMMSTNVSEQEADAFLKEQDNYLKSVFPGCMQYFQTTQAVECSKLQTLSTSYIMLDKDKKPAAKNKINSLPSYIQAKCPIEYKTMRIFIDD